MKLAWGDRSIELRLVDYQFPDCLPSGDRDWDANWLMVHGMVQDRDRSWDFRDPCMTTWEAEELIQWLRRLASGDASADRRFSLLEPNIEFERVPEPFSDVTLEVSFAAESRPPGWPKHDLYPVQISLDPAGVRAAADAFEHELARFPVRG